MNGTKNIFQSKIVWMAFVAFVAAILLFQYNIEIPEQATEELVDKLVDAIRMKNIGAGVLAIVGFFTGTFRIWFTDKNIATTSN